ncbi:phenylalanyl-tRNA synthetase beta subunit [Roseiarcus fermentans]|uniref:Phenylalanine--tRNA ligase beta subunit n=1 Tax=Roseiarcus fermentans TaxID=1473586 RepID=A0A366EYC6_9HYPH|nr:phenylalanine--tRNA ligase subunit beta [Roseiarcus fermentans]RBP07398.1 phenylalanyl-tRNA synthetase beta subunit [Roseiarcus fermentans]
MKFTLSWLEDHLDTQASLAEIVDALTRVGLEVEGVEDPGAIYAGFVVGAVIEAKPHPNADRLRVCVVDAGAGPVQVVCGAPNARAGMKSVFSPVGTYIPGKKITLAKGVIRGVESHGMLCSAAELELSNDHDGIMELPDDAPVGVPYARFAGLDDPVIDVALTPNRPDATGVAGIARDLAAAGLGTLRTPGPETFAGAFDCPTAVRLDFAPADAHLCPAFALRLVRGVANGPSPEWMQKRLRAIGLRPISALVDITNYVTFDRGRPLHVFDLAKIRGDLTVRRARAGESVLALDGKTYALDESTVIIADADGVESIAGVMGGEHSGCDESTRDVLIESALWDPTNIAQTGRKLGIVTDARYRFERGVDPDFCVPGLDLATGLVLSICGGEPSRMIVAGDPTAPRRTIDFPYSEVKRLIGVDIPRAEGEAILARLGFGVEDGRVRVPSWRPDVQVKADVVEQIIRIAGLDRAPPAPLPRLDEGVAAPVLTLLQKRTRLAKRTLASLSLREAVTWSFIAKRAAELFGGGQPALALANPIAADLSDMRPSLVPGLVAAAERNARRALTDVALFEVGQIFLGPGDTDQRTAAAAVRRGLAKAGGEGRQWRGGGAVDAFDAKADAMALLAALGVAGAVQVVPGGPAFLHPGRSATLQFGPKTVVGWFGELHPSVCEALDAEGPIVAFELVLDAVPAPKARPTKARPRLERSDFMAVERDLAFVVDESVRAGDLLKAAQAAERALVADVGVFDVYQGKGLPEGKKSIAIAVTLQPRERTLTDTEIEAAVARIVAEVSRRTGATLRA